MRTFCPKCDKDIFQYVYELEIRDFAQKEQFDCPYCGAKLVAHLEVEYCVHEDEMEKKHELV